MHAATSASPTHAAHTSRRRRASMAQSLRETRALVSQLRIVFTELVEKFDVKGAEFSEL